MSQQNLFHTESNLTQIIFTKYQRTEASLQEDTKNLKNWMKTQTHLPEILNDKVLENFLILNKCSLEKTKNSIDMYYTLRDQMPDVFQFTNPKLPNIQEVAKILYYVPFPKLTQNNYRVIYFKLRQKNLIENLFPKDVFCLSLCLQEVRLHEDVMYGDIVIYDMEGLTMGYLGKLTPSLWSKAYTVFHKIYSIPIKNFYVINSTSYISTILNILKSIVKPKLFDRIHVCKDTSILFEKLPRELIPADYGGEGQSLEELQGLLLSKFDEYQDRFDLLHKFHVNEAKRPQQLTNDDVLGFYGNFKKLSVD